MSDVQAVFRALADPTRRQILMDLSAQDMTIAQVSERFHITRSAVKKHLIILEQGGLISVHANGRERINQFEPAALQAAQEWLSTFEHFWDNKLSALKQAIDKPVTKTRKH
jgi:DNA-binding transcriptional ArsR family regulator